MENGKMFDIYNNFFIIFYKYFEIKRFNYVINLNYI